MGVKGTCAHCSGTFPLSAWHLNAIAINESFACRCCNKAVQLNCPKQLKRFRSLDALSPLKASMVLLISTSLLVALVCEWVGLISVVEQLNFSLLALLLYFATLRYARHRQQMTLLLQPAVRPDPMTS
ncbi:hypothetical protein [Pseudomonas gingeri]|uniref:Uncharacterized protein n=1 Tax=Pseudomonas gingeri TaxID=117681 RepID=A0A7Y7YBS8_9PSED|nr:hypothetical protein [Pseudomonas gingeri]NWB25344.1 hypothetical protein [Pseudomonas gingeri]NWC33385.1 hypothetical protein [Pseudomonas gingeri]NWD09767.1 hypothetical protein [Pseudomonas gingeri]NWD52718.1 hypothetical protein [Pseudomonas gingeri]NWE31837.1 hypothetical protein [Pseudomonas gingeri]